MTSEPDSFVLIDGHTHVGVDLQFYLQGHAPYGMGWSELCELGGAQGIGKFVVFPMPTHLGLEVGALREGRIVEKGAWEDVPYAFENRRMSAEIARHPEGKDRALPLWMFDPSRSPERQCAALRALHQEYPCSGLKVQATVIQSPISNLRSIGACLMDLAEEKDWPVLIHTSVHPDDPWSQVSEILRIVESRPRLRFNLAHSCRFDRTSLNRIAELPNAWFDCSAHAIHCDLAVQDHPAVALGPDRFPSDYSDPSRVLADLAAAYPGKLMWGSDAPFYSYCDDTFRMVSSYKREMKILRDQTPAVIKEIASTNILAFLGK